MYNSFPAKMTVMQLIPHHKAMHTLRSKGSSINYSPDRPPCCDHKSTVRQMWRVVRDLLVCNTVFLRMSAKCSVQWN